MLVGHHVEILALLALATELEFELLVFLLNFVHQDAIIKWSDLLARLKIGCVDNVHVFYRGMFGMLLVRQLSRTSYLVFWSSGCTVVGYIALIVDLARCLTLQERLSCFNHVFIGTLVLEL